MRALTVVAVLCLPATLVGQTDSGALMTTPRPSYGHATRVPHVTAVRRSGPIVLDAKLNEDAWKAATPITEFTQFDPDEGKPATQRTSGP